MSIIYRELVSDARRVDHTAALFGANFPLRLEPCVFNVAGHLSSDYHGGFWLFYALSNGGFYMAPQSGAAFNVHCENGFAGTLSADALGITACLYAYSSLSLSGDDFALICAEQFHLLRACALEHGEATLILAAID